MNLPRPLAAAALLLLATPLGADPTEYLYAVNLSGKLTVNGTVLEELPGAFEVTDSGLKAPDDAWVALEVRGPDRYSLRYDGVVRVNGKKRFDLYTNAGTRWTGLGVEDDHVFCLRSDGVLAVDGVVAAELPTAGFAFRRVVVLAGRAYSLRTDGALFRDGASSASGRFLGGPGKATGRPDGLGNDSAWIDAAIDPVGGEVLAVRGDGIVQSLDIDDLGDPVPPLGTEEAALPFVYDLDNDMNGEFDPIPLLDDSYVDIDVDASGEWFALAGDGRTFGRDSGLVPLDDFPGNGMRLDNASVDLAVFAGDRWALRGDGQVFRSGSDEPAFALAGLYYGFLTVSADPPNLDNFDEHKLKSVGYEVTTVVGTAVILPAMPTDIETPVADITLTPGEVPVDDLGSSATWNAVDRRLEWDAPQVKGTYKFHVTADDGHKPVKVTWKIKVVDPDADLEKNKKPVLPKIKNPRPIVGQPFSFPVVVDDRDGDDLTVTVDLADYPFNAGASFDTATRTFSWTPTADDQGDRKVFFHVFDGTSTQKKTVTLKVRNGLIF